MESFPISPRSSFDDSIPVSSNKEVADKNINGYGSTHEHGRQRRRSRPSLSRRSTFEDGLDFQFSSNISIASSQTSLKRIPSKFSKTKTTNLDSGYSQQQQQQQQQLQAPVASPESAKLHKDLSISSLVSITLDDYNTEKTLSPDAFDDTISVQDSNPHQSIANLIEDQDSASVYSSQGNGSFDEEIASSLSSETRENVALGESSYLNNIDYIRDHLDFLNQTLNIRKAKSLNSSYADFSSILPESIPGYSLTKLFSSSNHRTNILYYGLKVAQLENQERQDYTCKSVCNSPLEVGSKVLLSISTNILRSLSLSRLLNEWYMVSGLNPPKSHLLWTNETLTNQYITNTERPKLDKDKIYSPSTLPPNMPGVLYPVEVLTFTIIDEQVEEFPKRKTPSNSQKRVALVYPDNNYKSFKDFAFTNTVPGTENHDSKNGNGGGGGGSGSGSGDGSSSFTSSVNEGGRRSNASGNSNSTANFTPTESSTDNLTGLFNGISIMNAASSMNSLFSKLAHQVTSSPKTPLKVIEIVSDMITVVETLATVHELGFVHNGLTSQNLLKSETDHNDIKITGWEYSFSHSENCFYGYRKNHLKYISDSISYMSPEVSGVSNITVDYRSDFYSLGIIMYELVTGVLPFQSEDPNSIIRMHIFQKPVAPFLLAPGWISEKLSSTIMKCLEKNPADRYTDCYSLLADLVTIKNSYIGKVSALGELVWNYWKKTDGFDSYLNKQKVKFPEKVGHFPSFNFATNFIGRDDFYKNVFDTYNKLHAERVNMLFISGESGTGKTIILNDLRAEAFFKYDFYCFWKFSCFDSSSSIYTYLLDGIKTIIGQILECSEEIQSNWRNLIVKHIPLDLSILFYLIPDLRKLLGPKYVSIYSHKSNANTPGTPGREERTASLEVKFRGIIKAFYKMMGYQGLTLFIDDVHWCSEDSWAFLCDLLTFNENETDENALSVKIVVTYSTNAKQFMDNTNIQEREDRFKKYVNKSTINLHVFDVPKIPKQAYVHWVLNLFGARIANVNPKSIAASQQTSMSSMFDQKRSDSKNGIGNSFATERQVKDVQDFYEVSEGNLLLALYATRMARFTQHCYYSSYPHHGRLIIDNFTPKSYGCDKKEIVANYLNLATSSETRVLLEFAAIISNGSGFHLSDLIVAAALPIDEVFHFLQLLINAEIIVPTSTYYKVPFHLLCRDESPFDLTDNNVWELTSHCSYRFFHDSICAQIIEDLSTSDKIKKLSRLCALRYYKTITKEKTLNIGGYLQMAKYFYQSYEIALPNEKELYIEVLIQAGRYASSTYNMKLAQMFFETVGELVDVLDSKRQLKSTLTIADNHYYFKDYEKCLEVIETAQNKYGFDSLVFLYQIVRCKIQMGQINEAINICLENFPRLGITISEDEELNQITYEKLRSKIPISVPEIRGILKLKPVTNARTTLIFHLICQLLSSLVMMRKDAGRKLLVAQGMNLIFKYGSTPFAAMILLDFASDFVREFTSSGQLKAKELCKVALTLVNRAKNASLSFTQAIYEVYVCTLAYYFEPVPTVLKYFEISEESDQNDTLSTFLELNILLGTAKIYVLLYSGRFYEKSYSLKYRRTQRPKIGLSKEQTYLYDCEDVILGSTGYESFRNKYGPRFENIPELGQISYNVVLMTGLIISGKYDECCDLVLNKMHKIQDQYPVFFFTCQYYLVAALSITFSSTSTLEVEKKKTAIFDEIHRKFKLWSETNEKVFHSKFLFVTALKNMKHKEAESLFVLDCFEEAIEEAILVKNSFEVCWFSIFCARWLVKTSQNKRRIGKFFKIGVDILKKIDFHELVRSLEEEFGKVFKSDSVIYNLTGFNETMIEENLQPSELLESDLPSSVANNVDKEMSMQMKIRRKDQKAEHKTDTITNANTPYDLYATIQACLGISQALDEKSILMELLTCAIKFADVGYGVVVYNDEDEPKIVAVGSAQHIYPLKEEPLSSRIDICPFQLVQYVLESGNTVNKEDDHVVFSNRFGKDSYYNYDQSSSVLCVPLKGQFGIFGALYLEVDTRKSKRQAIFDGRKRDLLSLFCSQASVAMGKAKLIRQMELTKMAAEDATAEKASFLANMSHEIRTPFNSLLSCSIFLLDTPLNSTQREYVEAIKSSAMVTLNIIDGILAFSKIEHGLFTLDIAAFSLNDCIESAVQLGGEQVVDNELELVFFNNCPQINTVMGDITRVRQIIINLVGNAIKFTTQGHVIVSCNAIELTSDRYEIVISVEDTGIGIPKMSHNKVFGAFSQVDGSSRREYGGSGLGLAISKKLADIMGGDIRFESQEGVGTTFYFNVSFNVKLFDKPEIELPGKKALIISKFELTSESLKNMLSIFKLDTVNSLSVKEAKDIQEQDYLFISMDEFDDFVKSKNRLKKDVKIVILAQFGKPLTGESAKYEALLCPFQRERVIRLLKCEGEVKKEEQPSVAITAKLADEYPLRILLAEDNLLNYKVALKYLEKLGFKADHAKDGVQVLEKCDALLEKNEKYDVILMDIQMPAKDGITATKELIAKYKKMGQEDYIPKIVALTANVAGDDRTKCIECGMCDFISKPILPNELKRILTNLGKSINEKKNKTKRGKS
ncbi:CHK1 [Candida oxycetoniae]|uniref:histidine kinase n=1 Tax=Candida oxycetoniae TaxID=497107 RepID=A0AAI9T290_9ASCO|nr:CHK1 [Candida oxycetoniae]KAI3406795.2 CHK1 [Candida oxycetoniae]